MTPFRFVPHTADVAAELIAPEEPALREAGLDALRELLVGPSEVRDAETRVILVRGTDPTERLIHFLQEALYLFAAERFVARRITRDGVSGELFDPARHEARPEVKAVTYHGAEIRREKDGLLHVTIVFDV